MKIMKEFDLDHQIEVLSQKKPILNSMPFVFIVHDLQISQKKLCDVQREVSSVHFSLTGQFFKKIRIT